MNKRWIIFLVALILIVWLGMFGTDFSRVMDFEKPVFCVLTGAYDDGGSGMYRGLGYSFAIEGNFMPDDEYPGVTRYHVRFLGVDLKSGIRD